MCGRSAGKALVAALASALAACVSSPAPAGWRPRPPEVQSRPCGAWIRLQRGQDKRAGVVEGELIAVSDDHVYVLTRSELLGVPPAAVTSARLEKYRAGTDALGGWGTLGTISTLSHGWILVLTAPLWIISSTATVATESRVAQLRHPPTPLGEFRPWARFPQGLPPGFGDPGGPAEVRTICGGGSKSP
ncbi:MAG: hypothetical protein DMF77_03270 [Acidobacteria bacterium]|nr:MAG: hypothetical protein DMF77_03270 [Acidobacteriota bacterium]